MMNYRVAFRDFETNEVMNKVISGTELQSILDYREECMANGENFPAPLYTPTLAPLSRL